jgi:hypothetical protein
MVTKLWNLGAVVNRESGQEAGYPKMEKILDSRRNKMYYITV